MPFLQIHPLWESYFGCINKISIMKSVKFIPSNSSMKTQKALCIAALLWLLSLQTFATTYYARTNGGNWNSNATWSTVGYGNSTNTGTFPKTGDAAFIGDGYRVYITQSV